MKLNFTRVEICECRFEYQLLFGDEELAEMSSFIEKEAGRRIKINLEDVTNVKYGIITPHLKMNVRGNLILYDLIDSYIDDMLWTAERKEISGNTEDYWDLLELVEEETK